MEVFAVSLAAFFAAGLTFFSGFGLGTLLAPVFMLFFPVDLSIALTGVVHFANNLFKLGLVGRHAERGVLLRFGVPAVLAAFVGAWLLLRITDMPALYAYDAWGRHFEVTPVKAVVAVLLIVFALMDLLPYFDRVQFSPDKLPIGGLLSGFFGGLTGNQGALRAAFLVRAGLTKEAFVGTAAVVSTFVDLTRLSVYAGRFAQADLSAQLGLVIPAVLAGITGSYLGNRLLKKVTLAFVQRFVAAGLLLIALALGLGWV